MDYIETEIANLIGKLGEVNFKKLIKEYNKEYFKTSDVRIIDGPYDGGIDLEVRIEEKLIKRNIQITVQKTAFEKKLFEDVIKAKENVEKFDYQRNLDYYLTSSLSPAKKREYKKDALVKYEIELDFFDCKDLAELSDEYKSIKNTLYDIFSLPQEKELVKVDKQSKVLYDLLAVGKDTGELKKQFVHSFILFFIYENPGCTEGELISGLSETIGSGDIISNLIRGQISNLRVKGVLKSGETKNQLVLSEDKYLEIHDLLNTCLAQECILKDELTEVLTKHNIADCTNEVVELLYQSFQENYNADIEELSKSNNHHSSAIKKIHSDLIKFL